jgi:hypothetical protein
MRCNASSNARTFAVKVVDAACPDKRSDLAIVGEERFSIAEAPVRSAMVGRFES